MTERKKYDLTGPGGAVEFRNLPEGLKLRVKNGAIGEIIGNPHDGGFVLLRIVEDPQNPSRTGEEEPVFFTDVVEVVD